VTRHRDLNVRVRAALLRVIESAERRLHAGQGEEVFRGHENKTAAHALVAAETGQSKVQGGDVGKYFAVLAEDLVLGVGKLPILLGVLSGRENVDHFRWPEGNHGPQNNAVDEREDGRVYPDGERERQERDDGEPRRLDELPKRKTEILDHKVWPFL
jgi:hypothetical protein